MHHLEAFIFLDIEATLINGKQHIIEIGAIKCSPNKPWETFEQLIKPSNFKKLNRHIHNLTGITTVELLKAPSFQTVIQNFIHWCGGRDGKKVFVTFGEFDRKVLEEEFSRHRLNKDFLYPIVDYQQKYMIEHQIKSQPSLTGLMESLNIEMEQQHRALADANSLSKIFTETNGIRLIENQKTNEFFIILCDLVQKEEVFDVLITSISGNIQNESLTINRINTVKSELSFQVREVEKMTAEGETSIVQIFDLQPNADIQKVLSQLAIEIENKVLISLTGLKTLSKISRLHGISIPKTETISLKQLIKNEDELNPFKVYDHHPNSESTIRRQVTKFQHAILLEFKKRNLLKNEVKV